MRLDSRQASRSLMRWGAKPGKSTRRAWLERRVPYSCSPSTRECRNKGLDSSVTSTLSTRRALPEEPPWGCEEQLGGCGGGGGGGGRVRRVGEGRVCRTGAATPLHVSIHWGAEPTRRHHSH